jgi:hypothetical protein
MVQISLKELKLIIVMQVGKPGNSRNSRISTNSGNSKISGNSKVSGN